jgi:tetratricopeptide (TPR) repeat protein
MPLEAAVCPFCGGDLRVPDDRKTVKCMYCGKDIIVREAIDKAIGPKIVNYMTLATTAKKSRNNQEAYDYYNKVLELDPQNHEAWYGKGEAAGWLSTLNDFRLPEMISGVEKAVEYAPVDKKENIKAEAAQMMNNITIAFFRISSNHVFEYGSTGNAGQEFLNRCGLMINALEIAHSYAPNDAPILDNLIFLCKFQVEGVEYKDFNQYGEIRNILRITPESEAMLRSRMDSYVCKRKALDSAYQPPEVKKKGCFIVTATMGDLNHPYTLLLRQFRDGFLSKKSLGREFTQIYYRYSPYLADIIRNRRTLSHFSYIFLVKPWVWVAKKLLSR